MYFEADEVQAAIVTCGGLCPGLNTVIRELVCGLNHMYGVKRVLGINVRECIWHLLSFFMLFPFFLITYSVVLGLGAVKLKSSSVLYFLSFQTSLKCLRLVINVLICACLKRPMHCSCYIIIVQAFTYLVLLKSHLF